MTRLDSKRDAFLQAVRQTVTAHNMLQKGDSVLVGLSGGADSVALLLALCALREEYDLHISCAHVNHGLRGEAANRDMEFVISMCADLSVPLSVTQENVAEYAKQQGISEEMAGREIRYRFFREQHTDKIAVAHHKNDCAETMLINLLQGSLPSGIPPKRENVIRPLLGVSREEILSFLEACGQTYVTDATNFSGEYLRNRVRLELIPYLEEKFNKNFTNTVYHTSDVLWQEQQYLQEVTESFLEQNATLENGQISLCKKAISDAHPAIARKAVRQCYYRLRKETSISFEQIERLVNLCKNGQSGQRVQLPGNLDGILSGTHLVLTPRQQNNGFSYELLPDEWTVIEEANLCICLSSAPSENWDWCYPIRVMPTDQVTVRSRLAGDKLYYQNQKIHKKLSDFLAEHSIPVWERERVALIAVNGAVRIVAGYFYESVPQKENNLYYILIKKTGKGKENGDLNGTGC